MTPILAITANNGQFNAIIIIITILFIIGNFLTHSTRVSAWPEP